VSRPPFEVADIFAAHADAFLKASGDAASSAKRRVVHDLVACRTAALGGHLERCDNDECRHERPVYNSCLNRHCPKCQATAPAEWLEARATDLLPVEYFHVVFTVPPAIADLARQNKKVMYVALMRASAETLQQIAADPTHLGAKIGFLSILHTWNQSLLHHPHVHCVVPGGGLSLDGKSWVSCRPGFLLPVRVLSRVFRGKLLDLTRRAFAKGELQLQGDLARLEDGDQFAAYIKQCYDHDWVVYSKPPFGGPAQVLKYLARYTHRVAISNHRLVAFANGKVRFRWKDHAHGHREKVMTLDAGEFIRRFLLHVLPKRFVRIRYYGFLANRYRRDNIAKCRKLIDAELPADVVVPVECEDDTTCPTCQKGRMRWVQDLPGSVHHRGPRSPPRVPPVIDTS